MRALGAALLLSVVTTGCSLAETRHTGAFLAAAGIFGIGIGAAVCANDCGKTEGRVGAAATAVGGVVFLAVGASLLVMKGEPSGAPPPPEASSKREPRFSYPGP